MCQVADELSWGRVGLRDDSRQSRVPRKPSDWRGASESSAGRAGFDSPRGLRSWAVDFRESGRILGYREGCINPRCKLCNGAL